MFRAMCKLQATRKGVALLYTMLTQPVELFVYSRAAPLRVACGALCTSYSTFLIPSTTLEPPVERPPRRTTEPEVGRAWSRTRSSW